MTQAEDNLVAIVKENLIDQPPPGYLSGVSIVDRAYAVIITHKRLERAVRERWSARDTNKASYRYERAAEDFLRMCPMLAEAELVHERDIEAIEQARNIAYIRS